MAFFHMRNAAVAAGEGAKSAAGAAGLAVRSVGPTSSLGGAGSVESAPSIASMGGIRALGGIRQPDMLSALVEQAEVGYQKMAQEDARFAAPPEAQTDVGKPYTAADDTLLQLVVSREGVDGVAGIWDARAKLFNANAKNARTKNALRQRWNVLQNQGWTRLSDAESCTRKKQPSKWSAEDDACLRKVVAEHGNLEWLGKTIQFNAARRATNPSAVERNSSSVRDRWYILEDRAVAKSTGLATTALSSRKSIAKPLDKSAASETPRAKRFKETVRAHQKLHREITAINKDVSALEGVPPGSSEFEQEQLVLRTEQLVQAVENVDALWHAVQKGGRLEARVKLAKATCLQLTDTAKEVRTAIAAMFQPKQNVSVPETLPRPGKTKKSRQIRNANQHAQAGIARKVLLAWLAQEKDPPENMFNLASRSTFSKSEMVRLVNAALIEQGLLPAYEQSNLVNWFKNMAYKKTLVEQRRLPPAWTRKTSVAETRYLSGASLKERHGKKDTLDEEMDAQRYNIERLRALAQQQDQTIDHAIGQDEFLADHSSTQSQSACDQKTQQQQYAERAQTVLSNYIACEQPCIPDPYCATAW